MKHNLKKSDRVNKGIKMDEKDKKLEEILNKLAQNSSFISASPETIAKLRERGLPIKSTFTTYREYLDKLFAEKRRIADEMINKFPSFSDKIAHSSVKSLYEEIRECYALGLFGATITLSVVFLELGLKYRLHRARMKHDPSSSWDIIEKINLTQTINGLRKLDIITEEDKRALDDFNVTIRNPYAHYNIQKLVQDLMITELPVVKTETGEVEVLKNVKIVEKPYLWFSGKKFLDKKTVDPILGFCVGWINKVLGS